MFAVIKAKNMQNSFDLLKELPLFIKNEVVEYFSTNELIPLAMTSKSNLKLFKPRVNVSKLLQRVVYGEHEAVKSLLEKEISLIFRRGKVTDCSGRTFENISAFEYALWSLDKHMWTRMIHCIPSNKKRKQVFAELLSQYNNLINTKGVTYNLHGTIVTEKHFDFENTIIKALQTYSDLKNAPTISLDEIARMWEDIGGSQKLLPMHVIYEYCSYEPFYPVPTFTRQPTSSMRLFNCTTGKHENWFDADPTIFFTVLKGWGGATRGTRPFFEQNFRIGYCQQDWDALKALHKVRVEDFTKLKQFIENPTRFKHLLPTIWVPNRLRNGKEEVPTQCLLQ